MVDYAAAREKMVRDDIYADIATGPPEMHMERGVLVN